MSASASLVSLCRAPCSGAVQSSRTHFRCSAQGQVVVGTIRDRERRATYSSALKLVRPPAGTKVPPQITVFFWVIKILTTAMGEAVSDYLVHGYNPYLAVLVGFAAFVVAMILQYRATVYVPWVYWLAVLMVAVFGTMAADVLHVEFAVPYIASTIFFADLLVVFVTWYAGEGTLSIHSITTARRETFYWLAVLATFAWERRPVTSRHTPPAWASSRPGSCSRRVPAPRDRPALPRTRTLSLRSGSRT